MTSEEGNYFKKFRSKEIRIPKNPFSTGKEDPEQKEGSQSLPPEQVSYAPERNTIVPIVRGHQEKEADFDQEMADKREEIKIEKWHKIEQEFEEKMEELKKEENIEVTKISGDTGSHFEISKGNRNICSVVIARDGILFKSKTMGPEEENFTHGQRKEFMNKVINLCSK